MKDTTVAGRYARALYIVTERRGETAQALDELKLLLQVLHKGTRVGAMLATPQVLLADKRKSLRVVLDGRALRSVVLFVDLLLRKKRLREFDEIVAQYEALVEQKQGIKRAQVTSAVPLTADELARLHQELERTTRSRIKLASDVDPALLGGALVRIGDRVVDRTVRNMLEAIRRQLMEVSV